MHKLGIVIVTYNRSVMLSNLLRQAADKWMEYDATVYVIDGSENLRTRDAVESLGLSNVVYRAFPRTSIGYRMLEGCRFADAEYIYICGDSVVPVFENYGRLFDALDKGYDLIDFTYRDVQGLRQKEYVSMTEMYRELAWDMTQLGNVFFKKVSYGLYCLDEYASRYATELFMQNALYFDCFKGEVPFRGYFEATPVISVYTKSDKKSWQDRKIEVGCYGWYDYVANSPDKYEPYKKEVMLSHGTYSCLRFDRLSTFFLFRITGNLDYVIFKKYEPYMRHTIAANLRMVEIISRMPRGGLYILYRFARLVRRASRRVLGRS